MRKILIFCIGLIFYVEVFAQDVVTPSKVVVDDGYDHTELNVTPWGGSHGIFFGSKINYTGTNNLWHGGNTVYAQSSGQYSYGAFSMGYIANGGIFGFYDGGASTGAGNPISWAPVMTFLRGGSVGIGTDNPQARFHLANGDLLLQNTTGSDYPKLYLRDVSGSQTLRLDYNSVNCQGDDLYLKAPGRKILLDGNVAIGTTDPKGYMLAVNGSAVFTKVVVKSNGNWPDYVFHHSYKLRPLKDLANYIRQNNHLPDVPSANEVEKNGLDLGDNQALLLKKIEELTLYIIEQDKEIKDLKEQNQEMQVIKKELEIIKAKLQTKN